jgi:CheY-like chemotaxis protein
MMPVMNGWEFMDALAREPGFADVPIVVMTADRSETAPSLHRTSGVLLKPPSLEEIRSVAARFSA